MTETSLLNQNGAARCLESEFRKKYQYMEHMTSIFQRIFSSLQRLLSWTCSLYLFTLFPCNKNVLVV